VFLLQPCRSSYHREVQPPSVRSAATATHDERVGHARTASLEDGLRAGEDDVGDERRDDEVPVVADDEERPLGALAVTGFLTLTILVAWFGMYLLNVARS
jgi:hypothetical protein